MELNLRQKEIMKILEVKGSVSVYELSKTLYASEMTIRRDLTDMEKGGFLRRYRGGAVLKINLGEMPIKERLLLYKEEKEELSKRCLPFLKDDLAVFIDSSSTCQYLLPHLTQFKNITRFISHRIGFFIQAIFTSRKFYVLISISIRFFIECIYVNLC